nr:hypothetical protein Iba_chr13cCG7990 [Ipomoea batatas]
MEKSKSPFSQESSSSEDSHKHIMYMIQAVTSVSIVSDGTLDLDENEECLSVSGSENAMYFRVYTLFVDVLPWQDSGPR